MLSQHLRPLPRWHCPAGPPPRGSRPAGRLAKPVGPSAAERAAAAASPGLAAIAAAAFAATFATAAFTAASRIVAAAVEGRVGRRPCLGAFATRAAKAGHSSASEGPHRPPHQSPALFQASSGAFGSTLPSAP